MTHSDTRSTAGVSLACSIEFGVKSKDQPTAVNCGWPSVPLLRRGASMFPILPPVRWSAYPLRVSGGA